MDQVGVLLHVSGSRRSELFSAVNADVPAKIDWS